MNLGRFLRKCVTDPPAAWRSAKLVSRSFYGKIFWVLNPHSPLKYRIPSAGILPLYRNHSFTHCFWPAVESYEPDVRSLLVRILKPGMTFVDCGANVGYFSLLAGALVGAKGSVIAIEANPETFRMLQQNLELNSLGKAVHCAVSSQPGVVELFVPTSGDVYSSTRLGGLVHPEGVKVFQAPARTLDEILATEAANRVDVLKVDVEGGELDVLQSAPRLLAIDRPIIIMEYGTNNWPKYGATPDALSAMTEKNGYSIHICDTKDNCVRPVTSSVWGEQYVNLLLLPSEKSLGAPA